METEQYKSMDRGEHRTPELAREADEIFMRKYCPPINERSTRFQQNIRNHPIELKIFKPSFVR